VTTSWQEWEERKNTRTKSKRKKKKKGSGSGCGIVARDRGMTSHLCWTGCKRDDGSGIDKGRRDRRRIKRERRW